MSNVKNRDVGAPSRLATWITRANILKEDDSVELHAIMIDGSSTLASWTGAQVSEDPQSWGALVSELAQDDANERQATTTYRVRVLREGCQLSEHALKRTPKESTVEASPEMSLPGILSVIVRQNENLHKMVLQVVKESHAPLVQVVEMLTRRNAQLESSRGSLVDEVASVRGAIAASSAKDDEASDADKRMMERLGQIAEVFGPAMLEWMNKSSTNGGN